jgi:hypothetical protein
MNRYAGVSPNPSLAVVIISGGDCAAETIEAHESHREGTGTTMVRWLSSMIARPATRGDVLADWLLRLGHRLLSR